MHAELAAGLFSLLSLVGFTYVQLSDLLSQQFPSPYDPLLRQMLATLFNVLPSSRTYMALFITTVRVFNVVLWRLTVTAVWVFASAVIGRRLAAGPALPASLPKDITGKVALVTGCAAGIGFWTAFELALRGATVILGCRSNARSEQAAEAIRAAVRRRHGEAAAARLKLVTNMGSLELESFECVRAFAAKVIESGLPLHILVNNAGLIPASKQRNSTYETSIELSTCVNFLSPFLLTELLSPLLQKSKGRVVNVSSSQHRHVHDAHFASRIRNLSDPKYATNELPAPFVRYNYAKVCNIYSAHYAASEWNIAACSLHPGFVATSIMGQHLPKWIERLYQILTVYFLTKTDEEGATTSVYCSLVAESQILKATKPFQTRPYRMTLGHERYVQKRAALMAPYFADCVVEDPSELAMDERVYEEVMEWAKKTVGIK